MSHGRDAQLDHARTLLANVRDNEDRKRVAGSSSAADKLQVIQRFLAVLIGVVNELDRRGLYLDPGLTMEDVTVQTLDELNWLNGRKLLLSYFDASKEPKVIAVWEIDFNNISELQNVTRDEVLNRIIQVVKKDPDAQPHTSSSKQGIFSRIVRFFANFGR